MRGGCSRVDSERWVRAAEPGHNSVFKRVTLLVCDYVTLGAYCLRVCHGGDGRHADVGRRPGRPKAHCRRFVSSPIHRMN